MPGGMDNAYTAKGKNMYLTMKITYTIAVIVLNVLTFRLWFVI